MPVAGGLLIRCPDRPRPNERLRAPSSTDGPATELKPVGACAMTTKFLDNKICTFKILLSWRFPRKQAFRGDFPLCPQGPPSSQSENFIYIVVSPSLNRKPEVSNPRFFFSWELTARMGLLERFSWHRNQTLTFLLKVTRDAEETLSPRNCLTRQTELLEPPRARAVTEPNRTRFMLHF